MPRPPAPISVLMPVRNAEPYLEECLESLRSQTDPDFEIIAVDDGSCDASREILEAARHEDSRLRIITGRAEGLIPALNLGLEHCGGEFVARMDADDRAHPERLRLQRAVFADDPELAVVACLVEHFAETEVGEGLRIYEAWLNSLRAHDDIYRERFIESPVPHPGSTFRRSVVAAAGGYRDRSWPEDYDLWLRLLAAGCRFGKAPRVLHYWRDRPDRLTRADSRYAVERFLECKAEHLIAGPLVGCRRLVVWGAGQTGRRLTKHLLRRGAPLDRFIDVDRAKWGREVRGVRVEPPSFLDDLEPGSGPDTLLLAAVSSRGARALIRSALNERGFREGHDYWCVA